MFSLVFTGSFCKQFMLLDRLHSTIVYKLPVARLLILLFCLLFKPVSEGQVCSSKEPRAMLEYMCSEVIP